MFTKDIVQHGASAGQFMRSDVTESLFLDALQLRGNKAKFYAPLDKNGSFRRHSSQLISRFGSEKLNSTKLI